MYGSIAELLANSPDFQRMKIEPPSLPPVRQASVDPLQFLDAMLSLYSSGGSSAVSPDTAKSLATLEYLNRDRTPDFNPKVADDMISRRSMELLGRM